MSSNEDPPNDPSGSTRDDAVVATLATRLAPAGLNLVGTVDVADYDAAVPPQHALSALIPSARSAVVVGNGGGAFWSAYRRHCAEHPGYDALPNPLDAFTRVVVEAAMGPLGATAQAIFPFDYARRPVSFLALGELAGLGRRSVLGVLVHPEYGPWMALRAAVLLPERVVAPRPADGFDPCPTCVERACMPACPAGAVGAGGWDIPRCAAHRDRIDDPCAPRCHARWDCVLGRAHRYPLDEVGYHQALARGPLIAHAAARRGPR